MIYWDNFVRSQCFPDCSCELIQINSWINQPLAFWSSLAYLLPIYFLNKNLKEKTDLTRLWNMCLVLLTFCSMFCHASFIRLSVAMDFACIGTLMGFFLVAHYFKGKKLRLELALFFIAQVLVNYSLGKWEKIAICLVVYVSAFYELLLNKGKHFYKARSLQLSILILTVSFVVFLLDDQKIAFCDPKGWFAGHTLWHFGTAWSAYYYARFRFIDGSPSVPTAG